MAENDLYEQVESMGKEVIVVDGDGNCMYISTCLGRFGNVEVHEELRRRTAEFVQSNRTHFQQFVPGESIDERINKIRTLGQQGDHVELIAIAQVLQCNIVVLQGGCAPRTMTCEAPAFPDIYVSRHNAQDQFLNHYNSVIQRKQESPPSPYDSSSSDDESFSHGGDESSTSADSSSSSSSQSTLVPKSFASSAAGTASASQCYTWTSTVTEATTPVKKDPIDLFPNPTTQVKPSNLSPTPANGANAISTPPHSVLRSGTRSEKKRSFAISDHESQTESESQIHARSQAEWKQDLADIKVHENGIGEIFISSEKRADSPLSVFTSVSLQGGGGNIMRQRSGFDGNKFQAVRSLSGTTKRGGETLSTRKRGKKAEVSLRSF